MPSPPTITAEQALTLLRDAAILLAQAITAADELRLAVGVWDDETGTYPLGHVDLHLGSWTIGWHSSLAHQHSQVADRIATLTVGAEAEAAA